MFVRKLMWWFQSGVGTKGRGSDGRLYPSPTAIRMIKSGRMIWEEHVARMGDKTNAYWFMLGKLEGKSSLGKPRPR
jgi:hypothetical protein